MPGLADLQPGEFLTVFVDDDGEPAQKPGPVAGCQRGPPELRPARPQDGGVHIGRGGGRDGGDDLLGGRVEHVELVDGGELRLVRLVRQEGPHMRSKERRSSQSVTAASKASSSTRAMLR